MKEIICLKCYRHFSYGEKREPQETITIYACPFCNKNWEKSKVSGVEWKIYPEFKTIIQMFIKRPK